jgi:hypothetical protein
MNEPEMEPTEMAPSETETGSIYAWGLDDDGVDEPPTQRLTSRRITALGVAASLIVIAVAGVVAFVVIRQHSQPKAPSAPVVATVAAPPPTVTMTLPPPVTVTAAAPTGTVPSGPTIGDVCNDRMKFATDPVSGQEMICDNYSENISRDGLKWFSAEKGAVGPFHHHGSNLPRRQRRGPSRNTPLEA